MYLIFLCCVLTASLFGSKRLDVSNECNILNLPREIRLEIARFLKRPSEKYLLFSKSEQNDESFCYNTFLKENLDDFVMCAVIENLSIYKYELTPFDDSMYNLYNCVQLKNRLNFLYAEFVANPHNLLKYSYYNSLLHPRNEITLKKLCPGMNIINSQDVYDNQIQATIVAQADTTLTVHRIYTNPINYINMKIVPSFCVPLRIIMYDNDHFDYIYRNDALIEKYLFLINVIQGQYGKTFLSVAIDYNNIEKVKFLILNGADVNAEIGKRITPLSIALNRNNIEIIRSLVTNGANVNINIEFGLTPLHLAAWGNNIEIARLLLTWGASINAQDKRRNTPLHVAAEANNIETVRLLLTEGANPNIKNCGGDTPFSIALNRKFTDIVAIFDSMKQK